MSKAVKEFKIVDKKYLLIIYANGNSHIIDLEELFDYEVKPEESNDKWNVKITEF